MTYCDNETLKLLAWANYRGVKDDRLVFNLQEARSRLDEITDSPEFYPAPDGCPQDEYISHLTYFYEQVIQSIESEFLRRDRIQTEFRPADPKIIQTIKDRVHIDEVLSEYTEVYYFNSKITYQCPLHARQETPAGYVYKDQDKCWCFSCNKGGDIFDVVQLYGRMSLPEAIGKLARKLGIDTKPVTRLPDVF